MYRCAVQYKVAKTNRRIATVSKKGVSKKGFFARLLVIEAATEPLDLH